MYKVLKKCGRAKRAEFHTPHGVIQTPVFMNVGTAGAIKGGCFHRGSGAARNVRWSCPTPTICICAPGIS